MNEIRIKGTVFSGKGEGARFTELPWFRNQIREKLGFFPHIGTLNLKLTETDARKVRNALRTAEATEIEPEAGFCSGKCIHASLEEYTECAVIVPEIDSYPEDVVELIAPVSLRERLELKDGYEVIVHIVLE